ncbi:MAG: 30S ribosomal protein S13 [Planctomycetota bacterium]|nr:30S ribosomal protein S13 [Planctomycetota bacterium]
MPRVAGVDIPGDKALWVGLTYLFGIGPKTAHEVLADAGIDPLTRAKELNEEQISRLSVIIDRKHVVEGGLRRQVTANVQRLKDIGCYRGLRHRKGLPVRGQRTRTNARTRKGPRKTVAGKKVSKAAT